MNETKPPKAADTLVTVKKRRTELANNCAALLNQVAQFEKALDDHLNDWTEDTDPVTKQPFAVIGALKEDGFPWGTRICLFNAHHLDYLIRDDGALVERTSVPNYGTLYDKGFGVAVHPGESIQLRKTTKNGVRGVALLDELDAFLDQASRLPDQPREAR